MTAPAVAALVAAIDAQDCPDDDHTLCPECAGRVLADLESAGFLVVRADRPDPVLYRGACRTCGQPEGEHSPWCRFAERPSDLRAAARQATTHTTT